MGDFLRDYQGTVMQFLSFLYLPLLAFLVSMGVVYLFGRMLDLVRTSRTKNLLAFMAMVGVYVFYFSCIESDLPLVQSLWFSTIYASTSVILYVLVGFKLYDRVDNFLDKHLGHDKANRDYRKKRNCKD